MQVSRILTALAFLVGAIVIPIALAKGGVVQYIGVIGVAALFLAILVWNRQVNTDD